MDSLVAFTASGLIRSTTCDHPKDFGLEFEATMTRQGYHIERYTEERHREMRGLKLPHDLSSRSIGFLSMTRTCLPPGDPAACGRPKRRANTPASWRGISCSTPFSLPQIPPAFLGVARMSSRRSVPRGLKWSGGGPARTRGLRTPDTPRAQRASAPAAAESRAACPDARTAGGCCLTCAFSAAAPWPGFIRCRHPQGSTATLACVGSAAVRGPGGAALVPVNMPGGKAYRSKESADWA